MDLVALARITAQAESDADEARDMARVNDDAQALALAGLLAFGAGLARMVIIEEGA